MREFLETSILPLVRKCFLIGIVCFRASIGYGPWDFDTSASAMKINISFNFVFLLNITI